MGSFRDQREGVYAMKALILATGRGRSFEDGDEYTNSCMSVAGGRYLIEYSLQSAVQSWVEEIVIVVGDRAESVINAFGIVYGNIRISYVLGAGAEGFAGSLERAAEALEGDDFVLFVADEIVCNSQTTDMIRFFYDEDAFAVCGVVQTVNLDDIKNSYAVMLNSFDGRIYRLVAKPRKPVNSYMGTNNCVFKNEILEYLSRSSCTSRNVQGQLTDLVQCAIDDGNNVRLFPVGSRYVMVNSPHGLSVAEELLKKNPAPWCELVPMLA
jgi:NDP-sugar pyrophosphorylase family protein